MQNLIRILKGVLKNILFAIALLFLLLIIFCGFSLLIFALDKGQPHHIYGNIQTNEPTKLKITVYYTYDKGVIKNIGGDPSWNEYKAVLPLDKTGNFNFDSDLMLSTERYPTIIQQYQISCQDTDDKNTLIYEPSQHEYSLSCKSTK